MSTEFNISTSPLIIPNPVQPDTVDEYSAETQVLSQEASLERAPKLAHELSYELMAIRNRQSLGSVERQESVEYLREAYEASAVEDITDLADIISAPETPHHEAARDRAMVLKSYNPSTVLNQSIETQARGLKLLEYARNTNPDNWISNIGDIPDIFITEPFHDVISTIAPFTDSIDIQTHRVLDKFTSDEYGLPSG